jgi:hypothetical protein
LARIGAAGNENTRTRVAANMAIQFARLARSVSSYPVTELMITAAMIVLASPASNSHWRETVNLRSAISAVGVSTFAISGCSTNYAPRPNPRVAVVMQGGTPVYIREGRVYPGGGFGGDLREAVQGNPEAESYAKAYRTNMVAGVTTALAGVASTIGGGILYVASSSQPERERNATTETIGGTLALSGVAAFATGMVLMLNAQPHLWDAVNAYNDAVDTGAPPRAYGPLVTPPPYAAYAPFAPVGIAPNGARVSPQSDAPRFLGPAAPPASAPLAPGSGAGAKETAPQEPAPDLELDDAEAK